MDDEWTLSELLSMALRLEGCEVRSAADGRAALVSARDFGPDIILLDVMLPDMSGLEVLELLHRERPLLPVLLVSAKDSLQDCLAGLAAGGADYVTKPFSLEEVVARVPALLRRSSGLFETDPTATAGDLILNEMTHEATRADDVNALRYADTGVAIELHGDGLFITLAICDDGSGISVEDRDRVFERFTRLDDARSRDSGGSGLGLAIVRDVVTAHGGETRIVDGPRTGTRVTVTLPSAGE